MKRKKLAADPVTEVNGLSIAKWDDEWKLVPQGFVAPQPKLRHKVGLWAAKRGNKFFYIAAAANMLGSGLSGGLARAYVKNPSGDQGGALKKFSNIVRNWTHTSSRWIDRQKTSRS